MKTVAPRTMFLVRCTASGNQVGAADAAAHRAYLSGHGATILLGAHAPSTGQAPDPDRVFVLETDNRDQAEAIVTNDPFAKAGGYDQIDVTPLKVLIGTSIGGQVW